MPIAGNRWGNCSRHVMLAAIAASLVTILVGCADGPTADEGLPRTDPLSGSAAGPDATALPPWPAPTDVPARVAAAGLDLGPMGMAEHYHPQLQLIVSGRNVPVPANIGVDPATGAMSAVHTHTADGVIHIEADVVGQAFTLGQLFTEWGVKLTTSQIGGIREKPEQSVTVTVNGEEYAGVPAALSLAPNQEIIVRLE